MEFIGAATDKTCTVAMKGRKPGPLSTGGAGVAVDFYTDSQAPCPRAKVPTGSCDPVAEAKGELTFKCVIVPELRLSVTLPDAQALAGTGLVVSDPATYNNVEIVPAGRH